MVASATRPAAALPPAAVWHTIGMVRCACALPRCRSGFSCKSATSCCARRRLCRSAVKARGNKSAGFCSCCRRMTLRCGRALRRAHSPRGSAELQPCGSVARCMLYVVGCTRHVVRCRLHAVGCTQTALARHSTHARTPLGLACRTCCCLRRRRPRSSSRRSSVTSRQRPPALQHAWTAACADAGVGARVRMRHWAATQEIRRWEEDQRRLAREKETLTQQVRRAYYSVRLLVDRAPCRYIYIYIYICIYTGLGRRQRTTRKARRPVAQSLCDVRRA